MKALVAQEKSARARRASCVPEEIRGDESRLDVLVLFPPPFRQIERVASPFLRGIKGPGGIGEPRVEEEEEQKRFYTVRRSFRVISYARELNEKDGDKQVTPGTVVTTPRVVASSSQLGTTRAAPSIANSPSVSRPPSVTPGPHPASFADRPTPGSRQTSQQQQQQTKAVPLDAVANQEVFTPLPDSLSSFLHSPSKAFPS